MVADNLDLLVNLKTNTTEIDKVLKRIAHATGTALSDSMKKALENSGEILKRYRENNRHLFMSGVDPQLTLTPEHQQYSILEEKYKRLQAESRRMQWEQNKLNFKTSAFETSASLLGVGYALKSLYKPAVEYESSLTNVAKVYNLSQQATEQFSKELLSLAKTMPVPIENLGQLAYQMAQTGITLKELPEDLQLAVKAAKGLDIDFSEIGTRLGALKASFSLESPDMKDVLDFINEASNRVAATPAEILKATTRIGPLASSKRLSPIETATMASILLNAGWEPENVETGIKDFLGDLGKLFRTNVGDSEKYKAIQKLNLDRTVFEKKLALEPIKAIEMFLSASEKLVETEKGASDLMLTLFGQQHYGKLLTFGSEAGKRKRKELFDLYEAKTYKDSLQKEYDRVLATTAAQLQILANNYKALMVTIGNATLPVLKAFVSGISPILQFLSELGETEIGKTIIAWGASLGAVVAAMMVALPVLKLMSTAWAALVGLLANNPFVWITASVLTLNAALNELTGGLGEVSRWLNIISDAALGAFFGKFLGKGIGGKIKGAVVGGSVGAVTDTYYRALENNPETKSQTSTQNTPTAPVSVSTREKEEKPTQVKNATYNDNRIQYITQITDDQKKDFYRFAFDEKIKEEDR